MLLSHPIREQPLQHPTPTTATPTTAADKAQILAATLSTLLIAAPAAEVVKAEKGVAVDVAVGSAGVRMLQVLWMLQVSWMMQLMLQLVLQLRGGRKRP